MDCYCQFFHYLQRKPYRKLSFCSAPRTISLVMESLSSLRRFSIRPLNKSWFWARYVRPEKYHSVYKLCLYLRYGDMLLESKGEHFKVYSISTRLPVNNHQSFFFYLNIFVFRNMTSFGNIRRYLATSACLFRVIHVHLVVRCLFPMYSADWALVCYVYIYIYIFWFFSAMFV